nr:hypothetical protein [Tanacetum cinerariifolium]
MLLHHRAISLLLSQYKVFNSRTRKVEEKLHIRFLENRSNVVGKGQEWLFNIDSLTKSMNYEPVTAGNQTNDDSGIEISVNAGKAKQEKASNHEHILLPYMPSNSPLSSNTQSSDDKDADEVPGKGDEGVNKGSGIYDQERTDSSTQDVNIDGLGINTTNTNINTGSLNINTVGSNDPSMPSLEETGIFDDVYDEREVGAKADINNLELATVVYVDDIIFGSTKKFSCDEFEQMMHKRFQMSSMGELTFFLGLQTTSTLIEPNKALIKDAEAEDVDVHLYRSMIGSLMYLTASRPDIMFAVCACARFQVTPKTLHLHVVKRIFRYLKGQLKMGLWYPKDSPFDLEAFSNSDYAGASLVGNLQ